MTATVDHQRRQGINDCAVEIGSIRPVAGLLNRVGSDPVPLDAGVDLDDAPLVQPGLVDLDDVAAVRQLPQVTLHGRPLKGCPASFKIADDDLGRQRQLAVGEQSASHLDPLIFAHMRAIRHYDTKCVESQKTTRRFLKTTEPAPFDPVSGQRLRGRGATDRTDQPLAVSKNGGPAHRRRPGWSEKTMRHYGARGYKTPHDREEPRPTCSVHPETELVETHHDYGLTCPRCEARDE
jgi:hypothetical protein